jgi:hypothetical protein
MLFDRDGNRMTPSHAVGTGGSALVTVEKARKSGSHQTHRWREQDSNSQSPASSC